MNSTMTSYAYTKEYIASLRFYALQALSEGQREAIGDWPIDGPYGLRRWLAGRSLEAFAKLYFPTEFTLPFAPIHHQMLADMQEIRDRQVTHLPGLKLARAIPRNHAKSTFYSRLLPLHGFLYGWSSLTVLLGNNDDSAKRLVGNIKAAIETNPLLAMDFPLAEIKGSSWGIERLENNTGGVITSYGVGSGAVRGISTGESRPSLVVLDDIDDDRSVRSAIELANNIEWFDKSVSAIGDNVTYTTSFIAVGTIIRKTSLLKYIIDSAEYNRIVEQRIKQWSTSPLWDEWQTHYLELARNNAQPKDASEDVFYQQHKAAMLADTQVLWDKADEYYYAMVYRLAHGTKAFSSEMQNDPVDNDSLLGNIPYISLNSINEAEYDLLAALDPTVVGGKKNDLAAYVEVLFHRRRKEIIVSYVDAKQRTYGQTIDTIIKRIQLRRKIYNGLWIEDNAHGLIVKDLLNEKLRQNRLPYIANGIYNTQPKNDRIGILSEYIERGQLLFADNLPQEAIDELSMYPMAGHDDVLDAIATIVLYLKEKNLITLVQ